MNTVPNASLDSLWRISLRFAQYRAELGLSLFRLLVLIVGYAVYLWSVFSPSDVGLFDLAPADAMFYGQITLIVVAWVVLSALVLIALHRPWFPKWLPAGLAVLDGLLLSFALYLADGPKSPLMIGYFLLIGVGLLRMSTLVLWLSTAVSLAGFLALLGIARMPASFGKENIDWLIPSYLQVVIMMGMLVVALLSHRSMKHTKKFAFEHAQRIASGA